MGNKVRAKGKSAKQAKAPARKAERSRAVGSKKPGVAELPAQAAQAGNGRGKGGPSAKQVQRREALRRMLLQRRQEVLNEIREDIGHSLTEDQFRRLEGMDTGDQAMMGLDRELGISLTEMRNRRRQLIDEALIRVEDGSYGACADCGIEISEKRLAAVPFAKLCVECQTREELLEKIEREEERE